MAERFLEPNVPLKKIDNETGDTLYIYPQTTASQVKMDEDGTRLSTILEENIVYFEKENLDISSEIVDADSLGGIPASEYVLESDFIELAENAVSVNLNGASNSNQTAKINADLLGGQLADYYADKDSVAVLSTAVNIVGKKVPFSFAIDANGNYGYIKDGADTVTPFNKYDFSLANSEVTKGDAAKTYTFTVPEEGKYLVKMFNTSCEGYNSTFTLSTTNGTNTIFANDDVISSSTSKSRTRILLAICDMKKDGVISCAKTSAAGYGIHAMDVYKIN